MINTKDENLTIILLNLLLTVKEITKFNQINMMEINYEKSFFTLFNNIYHFYLILMLTKDIL